MNIITYIEITLTKLFHRVTCEYFICRELQSNPLNCDCTIYPFWSWLVVRPSTEYGFSCISCSATCSNGTLVTSLQVDALTKCNRK